MSTTLVAGTGKATGVASLRALLPDILFGLLVIYNTIRLFRHAMWRDELQAFMLTAASHTPLDLLARVQYENHPAVWYLLLWVVTRFTTDPFFVQVTQLLCALGLWVLIWRVAPFRPYEKLLLLLSYFLFWEYFIVSRPYALMTLLGFGFIALRVNHPEQRFWPWVLLALLANTTLFGAIWSAGLAAFFLLQERQRWRAMLPGAGIFSLALALSVATMVPPPDYVLVPSDPRFDFTAFPVPLRYVVSAFFPFHWPSTPDSLSVFGSVGRKLAATPFGSNPAYRLFWLIRQSPSAAPITLAVLALPLLACWLIVRDWKLSVQYALIYVGVLLFAQIWHFLGAPRHHGTLFMALVGTVWMWRSTVPPTRPVSPVWIGLLLVSALGGLTTLAADNRPFSQGRNTAQWIEHHHLDDALLIASRDYAGSTVAAYLQRSLYYLECECLGTYITWNTKRRQALTGEEVVSRIASVMRAEKKVEAYLISSHPGTFEGQTLDPNLSFRPLKSFSAAIVPDETYTIFRVKLKPERAPAN
jgi:hypothetical protein